MPQSPLTIINISLKQAQEFTAAHHRHHKPSIGHKFSVGVIDNTGTLRGIASAGRPVSRHLDDGRTLEVTRIATDGCPNACSALLGACRKAAKVLGYRKIITYTLEEEGGVSLRAAGWMVSKVKAGGGSWSSESRPRIDAHPLGFKVRWQGWQDEESI